MDAETRAAIWRLDEASRHQRPNDRDPFDDLREVLRRWEIGMIAATEPLRLAKMERDSIATLSG